MRKYLHELLTLLGPDRKRIPRFLMLFLIVSVLDVLGIGLIGPYIAIIAQPENYEDYLQVLNQWGLFSVDLESLILITSLVLLCIFVVKTITGIWINYIIVRFSEDQQIRLRSNLMTTYQSLPYTDYLRRNSSEYIHSANNLVNDFSHGVVAVALKTVSEGLVTIVILVFLAWTDFTAFMLLVGLLGPVIILYDRLFRKNIHVYGQKVNESSVSILKGIQEGIEGLKEIRILGCEAYFHKQVLNGSKKYGHFYSLKAIISTAPRYLLELIILLFIISLVLITLGLRQSMQDVLSTVGVFGLASIRLLPAASLFSKTLMQLRFYKDSNSRLYQDISERYPNVDNNIKQIPIYREPFDSLCIDNVSFKYPNVEQNALEQLNLDIHVGDSIGFIGSSGSGKTTLVDMLLGFLEPQQGSISYNDQPLNQFLKDWRSHVAYLPQQVFLIDNTFRRNIALGIEDEEIDEQRLDDAIYKARLTDLVNQLPKGVDTLLGERGTRLSGGQRQRVALARAFYYERDVLVMDEATSALDNETESEVVERIRLFKGKKTIIVIAHRLTTLQYCDLIYEISDGKIIKSGSYLEMCQQN